MFCAAIVCLGRQGKSDEAFKIFDTLYKFKITPTVFAYSNLVSVYAKERDFDRVLHIFLRMSRKQILPTSFIFKCVRGILPSAKVYPSSILETHSRQQIAIATYSVFVQVCALFGSTDTAEQAFFKLVKKRNPFRSACINSIINAYCEEANVDKALEWFRRFQELDMEVPSSAYESIIRGLTQNGCLKQARDCLQRFLTSKNTPTLPLVNPLLIASARSGNVKEATRYFQLLESCSLKLPISPFNEMITLHAQLNNLDAVWFYWNKMKGCGVIPDASTYAVMLRILTRTYKTFTGHMNQLLEDMVKNNVVPTEELHSALIEANAVCNRYVAAIDVFEDIKSRRMIPTVSNCTSLCSSLTSQIHLPEPPALPEENPHSQLSAKQLEDWESYLSNLKKHFPPLSI